MFWSWHVAGTPPMCPGIPQSKWHMAMLELSRTPGGSAPEGPRGPRCHPSMCCHGHRGVHNRLYQTQSKQMQLQTTIYMLAIEKQKSTEGVSDTHLLDLAHFFYCHLLPASRVPAGPSHNALASPCSAEASGPQRFLWFYFTVHSIVEDLCFQN